MDLPLNGARGRAFRRISRWFAGQARCRLRELGSLTAASSPMSRQLSHIQFDTWHPQSSEHNEGLAELRARLYTEPYGSVYGATRRGLFGALGLDTAGDSRTPRTRGCFHHRSRRALRDDPDGGEEAREGSRVGRPRGHEEGRAGADLQLGRAHTRPRSRVDGEAPTNARGASGSLGRAPRAHERRGLMNAATNHPAKLSTPTDRTLKVERIFQASRERVWRAHTDPKLLAQWWGRGHQLVIERFELERGGHWRFVEHHDRGVDGFE